MKSIIIKSILAFVLPAIIYLLFIYSPIIFFALSKPEKSMESFLLSILSLIVLLFLFDIKSLKKFKELNSSPIKIKYLLFMIPLSLAIRLPTAILFGAIYLMGFFGDVASFLQEGINLQWANLVDESTLNPTLEYLLVLSSVVVLWPIFEEILFRGIIFNHLKKRFSLKKSILFTSVLFMLIHLHPALFFQSFIMGMTLTYVYNKLGNITYPILLHMSINILPFLIGALFN